MRAAPLDPESTTPRPSAGGDSLLERAYLRALDATSDEAAVDSTAERLLDAAFDLFCRTGIQRTPMAKVCLLYTSPSPRD